MSGRDYFLQRLQGDLWFLSQAWPYLLTVFVCLIGYRVWWNRSERKRRQKADVERYLGKVDNSDLNALLDQIARRP